jgi:hypothetical protein
VSAIDSDLPLINSPANDGSVLHDTRLAVNLAPRSAPGGAAGSLVSGLFGSDGHLSLKADCNRAAGAYAITGDDSLTVEPIALSRAMCAPGSLSDRFARDVGRATSYDRTLAHQSEIAAPPSRE